MPSIVAASAALLATHGAGVALGCPRVAAVAASPALIAIAVGVATVAVTESNKSTSGTTQGTTTGTR